MQPQQPQQPGWNPYGPTPADQQWAQGQQAPYDPNYQGGFAPQQAYGQQAYAPRGPYGHAPSGQPPYAQIPQGPSPAVPMSAAAAAFLLLVEWTAAVIVTLMYGNSEDVLYIPIPLIIGAIPLVLGMLQLLLRMRASRWVLLVGFVLGMPLSFVSGAALIEGAGVHPAVALGIGGVLSAAGIFLVVVPPTARYLEAGAQQRGHGHQFAQPHMPPQPPAQQRYPQQRYPQQPYPQQQPQQQWYPHQ